MPIASKIPANAKYLVRVRASGLARNTTTSSAAVLAVAYVRVCREIDWQARHESFIYKLDAGARSKFATTLSGQCSSRMIKEKLESEEHEPANESRSERATQRNIRFGTVAFLSNASLSHLECQPQDVKWRVRM